MSERVNEDELAAVLDLDVRESIRYRLAVEVQQYRARIAAHAAAHPERLSEGEVNEIIAAYEDEPAALEDALDADTIAQLAVEVWQRRTWDLTPDETEALRTLLASLDGEPRAMRAAIEKIFNAHGSRP